MSTISTFTEYFISMLSLERNRLKIISEEFMAVVYIERTLPEKSLCSQKKVFANRKFKTKVNPR